MKHEYVSAPDPHAIAFGRWILKHAETHIDKEGMFCWLCGGREMATVELYEIFIDDHWVKCN
jgi:hypothetical protein